MTYSPIDKAEPSFDQFPEQPEKESTLAFLFPKTLLNEIAEVDSAGYDITIGDTYDKAYDTPEGIFRVRDQLELSSYLFEEDSRRAAFGSSALALAAEHLPLQSAMAKKVRRRIRMVREDSRARHLFNRADVQAMPWHEQGGKALALGTIIDAHDLRVYGESHGLYETMSGRFGGAITGDYEFPETGVSPNLAGKYLWEAAHDVAEDFRGNKSAVSAQKYAAAELDKLELFNEALIQPGFKDIVQYCTDSLGIRSRKEEVHKEINRHVDASGKDSFLMMSVGCGTALPMLEVMHDLKTKGKTAKMILVDQDPIALAAAAELARQLGLEDSIEIHCNQLFVREANKTRMMDLQEVLQGRELDVCEDSGLREYFPDAMYEDLTRQAWNALADGGLMTTGNMNKNRPQAHFLHGLMGWPIKVRMRNIRDVTRLHAKAGVPAEKSRLRVTQEGVYTLCFSTK